MKRTILVIFFLMSFVTFSSSEEYFCQSFPEQMQIIGTVSEVVYADGAVVNSCNVKIELLNSFQHGLRPYISFNTNVPIIIISKDACPLKGAQVSGVLCRDDIGNVYLEADY